MSASLLEQQAYTQLFDHFLRQQHEILNNNMRKVQDSAFRALRRDQDSEHLTLVLDSHDATWSELTNFLSKEYSWGKPPEGFLVKTISADQQIIEYLSCKVPVLSTFLNLPPVKGQAKAVVLANDGALWQYITPQQHFHD